MNVIFPILAQSRSFACGTDIPGYQDPEVAHEVSGEILGLKRQSFPEARPLSHMRWFLFARSSTRVPWVGPVPWVLCLGQCTLCYVL